MRTHGGRRTALAALLGAVALWSGSLSVVRIAVESADPGTVTFWRCVVGAVALATWVLVRRGGGRRRGVAPRATRRAWAWTAASGVTCGAAFLLIADGMRTVGSGPAGIVLSTIPGLTILISAIDRHGQRLGMRHVASLGLGALGALTLAIPAGGGWSMTGIVLLALAALAHAATNVTSGHGLERLDPVVVAAASMGVAALVSAPFASFDTMLPLEAWLAIAVLGVLPSGLAYVMYFHGIHVLGTERAAYSNFLVPPVAVLTGMVGLGEMPDLATIGALALATLALYVGVGGGGGGDPLSGPAAGGQQPAVEHDPAVAPWRGVVRLDRPGNETVPR